MPKNEDGEFELVLGNKQLLSMFFVVVVLLGVFFVMGYIVGRNSAPLVASETTHKPEANPLVVESPAPKQTTAPEAQPTPAPQVSAAVAPEKSAEKVAEPAPTPETVKAEPKPEAPSKREVKAAEQATAAEAAAQAKATKGRTAASSNQPVTGAVYLQLSATDKTDADKMVEVLRKNHFMALDSEVPEKPGTFRVLVGPVPTGEYNKWKADLQSKGFPGNAAIRKTF